MLAGEIEAIKFGDTVTVPEVEAEHPLASVNVTLYMVVDEGLTVIPEVVAPVLHE